MKKYKNDLNFGRYLNWCAVAFVVAGLSGATVFAQATNDGTKSAVTVEMAMSLQPVQRGVDVDQLTPEEMKQSTVTPIKEGKSIGYVVKSPQGVILRMFLDTDDIKGIDQWSYYKNGLEVYRDIDSNGNRKADQYRWFHSAGSRWGIDTDEDGVVDFWKSISPEEVSAEVAAALVENDVNRFLRVALNNDDLAALQCGEALNQKLSAKIAALSQGFQEAVAAIALPPDAEWLQFGGNKPSMIPAGRDDNKNDLLVYQNTLALVGDKQIVIGSMVKVGDTWKVVDAPHVDSQYFVYISPFFPSEAGTSVVGSEELIAISDEIEELNQRISNTTDKAQHGPLYDQVVNKMIEAANKCSDAKERHQWLTNLADTMSTAVYLGNYPDGLAKMQKIEEKLKEGGVAPMAAYFREKRIVASYYTATGTENAENAHKTWIENLEQLIQDYPNTISTANAMLRLGQSYEESAKTDDAKTTYSRIVSEFPGTTYAAKAEGALKRLDANGNVLTFSGKSASGATIDIAQLKGNIVLLYFWASWADERGDDVTLLKNTLDRYSRDGLKIVGVNLDNSADDMNQFITKHAVNWPQIHEPGGIDSRPANSLGIQEPPFYILIDKEGKMVSTSIMINEIDREIFNLTRK